ncbi:MAG: S-layer homology domain-containing protein [Coleofasciculaceae cyanobacterium SM2_3_26]|nr:S-layer homology domain-containing protein [Coleofasciculaceae cyanobacterium SM2_3_26]
MRDLRYSFPDVPRTYWASGFIARSLDKKIVSGYPDGFFRPTQLVTRAEFAAIVAQAFNRPKIRRAVRFADVPRNYWAAQYIQVAYEMGFLDTVSGSSFDPNARMSRADVLVALVKGLNLSASRSTELLLQTYGDLSDVPTELRSILAIATEYNLVVNYPDVRSLRPNQLAIRSEACAFIYQALVATGDAVAIDSPYVIGGESGVPVAGDDDGDDDDGHDDDARDYLPQLRKNIHL